MGTMIKYYLEENAVWVWKLQSGLIFDKVYLFASDHNYEKRKWGKANYTGREFRNMARDHRFQEITIKQLKLMGFTDIIE